MSPFSAYVLSITAFMSVTVLFVVIGIDVVDAFAFTSGGFVMILYAESLQK